MAHPERGRGFLPQRGRTLTSHRGLGLVGSVAKLLNAGLDAETTLAAVAEALRLGLPAEEVSIWSRDHQTGWFRVISSPAADASPMLESLEAIPAGDSGIRLPLQHEEAHLGLLEARTKPSPARLEVLAVVANLLAPFLGAHALSADFAVEVAAQSREIDEQRRFTSLIIDSLPVGLYVVDREYRIQTWNRQREIGAPGPSAR